MVTPAASAKPSLRRRLATAALALAAVAAGVVLHFFLIFYVLLGPEIMTSYRAVDRIYDEGTGVYVELGEYSNMSSLGLMINLFDDAKDGRTVSRRWEPILDVANVDWRKARTFHRDGGCYVLEVEYRYGGLATPVWTDPATGRALCFRLLPDPGPKGGWKP